jgi:hypothetical protein
MSIAKKTARKKRPVKAEKKSVAVSWQKRFAGTYGIEDLEFAVNPNDEPRAKKLINAAHNQGATFREFWSALERELKSHKASAEHVTKQGGRALKRWRQWAN